MLPKSSDWASDSEAEVSLKRDIDLGASTNMSSFPRPFAWYAIISIYVYLHVGMHWSVAQRCHS